MNAAELMKRSENALRTGQTVNLFPVLARRTLQQIETERTEARLELGISRFIHAFAPVWNAITTQVGAAVEGVYAALQTAARDGGYESVEAMLDAAEAEAEPTHIDYALQTAESLGVKLTEKQARDYIARPY